MDFSSISADQLIAECAKEGHFAAWEEFIRRFNPLITKVALRVARRWGDCSPATVDDLVQETYLKLCGDGCRVLRSFRPNHPDAAYGFIKVLTANLVQDHFKASRALRRGAGSSSETLDRAEQLGKAFHPLTTHSPEREIILHEIDQHLVKALTPRDLSRNRRIFWLYYRSGLTASAIAALPSVGLSTEGVETVIFKLTRLVKLAFSAPPGKELQDDRNLRQSTFEKGISETESL